MHKRSAANLLMLRRWVNDELWAAREGNHTVTVHTLRGVRDKIDSILESEAVGAEKQAKAILSEIGRS